MLVEVKNLCGGYGRGDIVRGVSCAVDAGEVLCLLGPNGCGKTTFFRLILGSLKSSGGSIRIAGQDIRTLAPKALARLIAYIPQHHMPVFAYTALEIVMMGRVSHFSSLDAPKPGDRDAAFAALERLGALHLANERYTALSGGQRQMVLIARAIAQEAKVFVMDEPGASLDFANHQLLVDLAADLAREGYCVIMSTHSPEHPFTIGDKVLLMHAGRVAAFGKPSKAITPDVLEQVYGIPMDVVRVQDRNGKTRTVCLPLGQVPQAAAPERMVCLG